MLTYCNFGQAYLPEAAALGLDGIRLDVPADGALDEFVRPFVGSPLCADFLLHDPGRLAALLEAITNVGLPEEQTSIEVYNEPPHKDQVDEDQYIDGVLDVWEDCQRRGYRGRVIAGACMNLSSESMRWYRRTVPEFPADLTVAFHEYPYGLQADDLAWPPSTWADDPHQDALNRLRAITRDRPLVCSELGRHRAIEIRGAARGGVEERVQDLWIYWFYLDRLRLYAANDIVFTALYQWQDDPDQPNTSEGLYGLHAVNADRSLGPAKKQAEAIADWSRFPFSR